MDHICIDIWSCEYMERYIYIYKYIYTARRATRRSPESVTPGRPARLARHSAPCQATA